MKKLALFISLLLLSTAAFAQEQVELWKRFELSFQLANTPANPEKVELSAVFVNGAETFTVRGFYDGDNTFRIRFMPQKEGVWKYRTQSSSKVLNNKRGSFVCVAPSEGNHGPVSVNPADPYGFSYADGTVFHPIGTTIYDWLHQPADRQERTYSSLEKARFNKVRFCLFPKYYPLVHEEPDIFPFVKEGESFDFNTPDPRFWHHFEEALDRMDKLGIQADLILFHPYDKGHWGFDSMPREVNLAYIDYLVARFASFKNVWWSLANEYDYLKAKTEEEWAELVSRVVADDPYGHLCSIHGSTAKYYPYWTEGITHTSIQDEAPVEDFGRAATVRNIYGKPVIFDEVCYEGNLASRWGRMSGEEMLHRIWQGLIAGTYVTHGECYQYEEGDFDEIFWAKGGDWRGESWKRIGFTLDILAPFKRTLQLADTSRDHQTATDGEGNYYVYFGTKVQDSWLFNIPNKCASFDRPQSGNRYKVEIIDTWNMTIRECPETFELGSLNDYRFYDSQFRKIRLPLNPYILLRITRL